MKKTPMNWDEHVELGHELLAIKKRLGKLSLTIPNRLGLSSKAGKKSGAAVRALDELRSELDSVLYQAFPGKSHEELASVYFGEGDGRA
jgi:hypothetical protein